jgi:dUTP pyrophosphatase
MSKIPVLIRRLDKSVPLPEYQTPGSVAFDIHALDDIDIEPESIGFIKTGLIMEVPVGHTLILASRSSGPKKMGLHIPHGIGIIDQDYHGPEDELIIQVYNPGKEIVSISKNDRVAQGMIIPVAIAEFEEVDKLAEKSRGNFGSTGR